jgi:methylenetetrahydrofolate reductase (NADPH)
MVYGPCGGVRRGGGCEVDGHPCPFIAHSAPQVDEVVTGGRVRREPTAGGRDGLAVRSPIVVCDFRPTEATVEAAASLARAYAGWCDAVLLGDHHDRVDLPGPFVAAVAQAEGCNPWVTLSCRDRNRVVLEADLAACAELNVGAVHCVTGDARAAHVRPDATQVFDLDSMRLTALAATFGLTVSVAESPLVVPIEVRPGRVADKSRAGADWCFVNIGPTAQQTATFIGAARAAGADLRYIVCIPMFTDADGASRLQALPGLGLEPDAVHAILASPDPISSGIDRAVTEARRFLDIDGVAGVNLSGPASTVSTAQRISVLRATTERLR